MIIIKSTSTITLKEAAEINIVVQNSELKN